MIEIPTVATGCSATRATQLPVNRNEVDQRASSSQLNKADVVSSALDGATKGRAVEMEHALQIAYAKDEMVNGDETEHCAVSFWSG